MANELKFTALQANSSITLNRVGNPVVLNLEFSMNGTTWQTFNVGTTYALANAGDYIMLRAPDGSPNAQGMGQVDYNYHQFAMSGQIAASGNIMCLYDYDGATSTVTDWGFGYLFQNCNGLVDASDLLLPATTIDRAGYGFMFDGCSNLVYPPSQIDAEHLIGTYPFGYMFQNCSSLLNAPKFTSPLDRTTESASTFQHAFHNCTSLKRGLDVTMASDLPKSFYDYTYAGCSSLEHSGVLLVRKPGDTSYGYNKQSFQYTFENCSKLTTVCTPMYLTYIGTDYSRNWLSGVPATGTVYYTGQILNTPSSRNASTIPNGWTIAKYVPLHFTEFYINGKEVAELYLNGKKVMLDYIAPQEPLTFTAT